MRLRYILRKYSRYRSYIWPPVGPYADGRMTWDGVLTAVRRIGERLSLTIRLETYEHVVLLDEWVEPPTVNAVERALVRMVGRSILAIGEAEIGEESGAPPAATDDLGF
jgi:hypothetical protein